MLFEATVIYAEYYNLINMHKEQDKNTSSNRSASFADSASATTAGGGGPIKISVSSSNSASLEVFRKYYYKSSSSRYIFHHDVSPQNPKLQPQINPEIPELGLCFC